MDASTNLHNDDDGNQSESSFITTTSNSAFSVKNKTNPCTPITIVNTNARSLCPKIHSYIECLEELDAQIGIVTETWLSDGVSLEEDKLDLEHGAGLGMLTLNRKPNAAGVSHGGVAITFRKSFCSLSRIPAKNPDNFEVLPAVGSIPGHRRKLVVFACYIPPSYDSARGKKCLEYISDMVCVRMRKYNLSLIHI